MTVKEAGSKTLLGPKETKGKIILQAAPTAPACDKVPDRRHGARLDQLRGQDGLCQRADPRDRPAQGEVMRRGESPRLTAPPARRA